MTDVVKHFPPSLLKSLSRLFQLLVSVRLTLYRTGYITRKRTKCPTISVGNITVGGTGKTPLVEHIAQLLLSERYLPSIISRGYGRRHSHRITLVSDGSAVLADVQKTGDEPLMLARHLPQVIVAVGADRVSTARWVEAHFRPTVHILDDGFQHLRLERDIDLVTIDALDPFGSGELLPFGRLREPLGELRRATAIVVTHADRPFDQEALQSQIRSIAGEIPVFYSFHETVALYNPLTNDTLAPQRLFGQSIGAFCAIGNPAVFRSDLEHYQARVVYSRSFRDHYAFKQQDVREIVRGAQTANVSFLVTTEKDWIRLEHLRWPPELPVFVMKIKARIEDEAAFRGFLLNHLSRSPQSEAAT